MSDLMVALVGAFTVRPITPGAVCPSGNAAGTPNLCDWCPAPAVWDVADGCAWCDHACTACLSRFDPSELVYAASSRDPAVLSRELEYVPGVNAYVPLSGKVCYSVRGPRGVFLVTPAKRRGDWQVWRSDSLRTAGYAQAADAGVLAAMRQSGVRS